MLGCFAKVDNYYILVTVMGKLKNTEGYVTCLYLCNKLVSKFAIPSWTPALIH